MREITILEILNTEMSEHVIEDRRRHLDIRMSFDHSSRLKPRERKLVHEDFERYPMLKSKGNGLRQSVHERPEGSSLLVHVQEDFPERPVLVLARPYENLISGDPRLLSETFAAVRELALLEGR